MAEPTSVRERGDLRIATIVVDGDRHPAAWQRVAALFDPDPPTPTTPVGIDPMLIWRSPGELLVVGTDEAVGVVMADVAAAVADIPALLEPCDRGLVPIELTGPDAVRACPLPFDAAATLRSATTRLADLRVTMIHHPQPDPRIWLIVDRPSVGYLLQWLAMRVEIAGGPG